MSPTLSGIEPDRALSRYRLADGIAVRPFHGGANSSAFLVEGPSGNRWEVTAATANLLQHLGDGLTIPELAEKLAASLGAMPDHEQIARYLNDTLVAGSMVVRDGHAAPASPARVRLSGLSLRTTLLSEAAAARLARPLVPLMTPRVFALGAIGVALCAVYVWNSLHLLNSDTLSPGHAILVFVILAIGFLLHEVGHIAAARCYGARHGHVGVGVYIAFPVLFVELDDVWKLTRRQRVVVDLAGVYVQLLFALGVLALARVLAEPFVLAAAMSAFAFSIVSAVVNLAPVFRLDGYWVVSDALGIPNLRQRTVAWSNARRRGDGNANSLLTLNQTQAARRTIVVIGAYAFASTVLVAWWSIKMIIATASYLQHRLLS